VLQRAVATLRARSAEEQATPGARADLARALYLLGEYDAAAPLATRLAAERGDDPQALVGPGLLAARRGQRTAALQVDERLRRLTRPYDQGQTPYARARLAAQLGDLDAALTHLREALERGVPVGPAVHADPDLAPLRGDPRYRDLLRPKG
jgi:Flp pilus assembly protein TadD